MNAIRLSPTVKMILWICGGMFLFQQTADRFFGANIEGFLGLVPQGFIFQHRAWQIVTYTFLHADPTHLILNMLMLAFVASDIEFLWGRKKFILFYLVCAVFAGVVYLFFQIGVWRGEGLNTPMVGASAAIYGLLVAYGWLFGERTMLFMLLFPMKAKHFVWVLAGMEFLMTAYSGRAGLSSAAHISGMIAGAVFLWIEWLQKKKIGRLDFFSKMKPAKKSHLKLVVNKNPEDDREDKGPKTWH